MKENVPEKYRVILLPKTMFSWEFQKKSNLLRSSKLKEGMSPIKWLAEPRINPQCWSRASIRMAAGTSSNYSRGMFHQAMSGIISYSDGPSELAIIYPEKITHLMTQARKPVFRNFLGYPDTLL